MLKHHVEDHCGERKRKKTIYLYRLQSRCGTTSLALVWNEVLSKSPLAWTCSTFLPQGSDRTPTIALAQKLFTWVAFSRLRQESSTLNHKELQLLFKKHKQLCMTWSLSRRNLNGSCAGLKSEPVCEPQHCGYETAFVAVSTCSAISQSKCYLLGVLSIFR